MLVRLNLLRALLSQHALDCRAPIPWEFTQLQYELVGNIIDVLGPIAILSIVIQPESEPVVHSLFPGLLLPDSETL